jgi:predicted NUDIX family NTP pyrophosphohydrolase
MPKQSAGILLYRLKNNVTEVFLCHPGGPFYRNKDAGAWTVPKGEFENGEDPLAAANREFYEETGQELKGEFISLTPVKYKSGKIVYAWLLKSDFDADTIKSNEFLLEWPPRTGKYISVPEIDRAAWFNLEEARQKILPSQLPFLIECEKILNADTES